MERCEEPMFQKAEKLPTFDNLMTGLKNWQWILIDGLKLPAVTRNSERYVSVHMVQLKLLSKFPPDIPKNIINTFTMSSHKMTLMEAWTFNSINCVIRKFDLGCQLFTTDDELVKLNDVQRFYWNVKALNLMKIKSQYDEQTAQLSNSIPISGVIKTLRAQIDYDLNAVQAELQKLSEPLRDAFLHGDEQA